MLIKLQYALVDFSVTLPEPVVIGLIVLAVLLAVWLLARPGKKETLTHAGGLVYKTENGKRKYLVITSSRDENRWVLPKGHIEKGETPLFAAIREVLEETGVFAQPVKPIGHQRYKKGDEKVHVKYYLMRYVQTASANAEKRKQLWLSKEDAIKQISFNDTRRIIEDA